MNESPEKQTQDALRSAHAQLEQKNLELDLLVQASAAISSTLDLRTLLDLITELSTKLSAAQFGAFFYNAVGNDGEEYQLYTLSGASRKDFENFGYPRPTAIFAPTFHGEGAIRSPDVQADPRYGLSAPHHGMPPGHLPVRSYLAVPVVSRTGKVFGGLFFGHSEVGVFDAQAERLVSGIAAQAGIALDNARLYEDARRDVQERARLYEVERTAREEAERIGRLKDEFLATLSHELRTPLSAILGWSRLLQSGGKQPADIKKGLEVIARNAHAQTQLIEELLDMSRIVSGRIQLDVQNVELGPIVEAAVESARPAAAAKDIRLQVLLDQGNGLVACDPHRFQQIVWNLLSNAVKFTPRGGKVKVVLKRQDSSMAILVDDTGIGIGADFLPYVFDRFRQADGSSTRSAGGLGLGLSIVKHLVELHGGSVHASSRGTNLGAQFRIVVPLAPRLGQPAVGQLSVPAKDDLPARQLAGLRILVVEDEPDARELVRQVLASAEAHVFTAASVEDALRLFTDQQPDLIVSDIGLPGRDGYDLIRQIRLLPPSRGGTTPAIALTAYTRSDDRTKAIVAGFHHYLSKPVEPEELLAVIASVAGRSDAAHVP